MTGERIWLLLCACGLSACITYAWWVVLRVMRLRQDLLTIRDGLFDCATNLHALDDPAYRAARHSMNALVHMASALSLRTMVFLFVNRDRDGRTFPEPSTPEVGRAIDTAFNAVSKRIYHYILNETFGGWIARLLVSAWPAPDQFDRDAERVVRNGVESRLPREIPVDLRFA